MFVVHLYDKDYNDVHKYKVIASLSQVIGGIEHDLYQRPSAKHYHVYEGLTLVASN